MTETPQVNPLTTEQQQRAVAVDLAAKALKQGGASLTGNTSQAGDVKDIIDLAGFIANGEPYSVTHAHSHSVPDHFAVVDIAPGSLQADALGGLFNQTFGFNPFEPRVDDSSKTPSSEDNAPDFD